MNSRFLWMVVAVLAAAGAGCAYHLDVSGKQCNTSDHPCPSGYVCVQGGDGGSICQHQGSDGGSPDGGDHSSCSGTASTCPDPQDLSKIQTCDAGKWKTSVCETGKYCYDPNGNAASCVAECTLSSDCQNTAYYCNQSSHHCEKKGSCSPPDGLQCDPQHPTSVLQKCDPDSRNWVLQQTCGGEQYCDTLDPSCKDFCDDDTTCQQYPGTSCDLPNRQCVKVQHCTGDGDCGSKSCDNGACLVPPTQDAAVSSGSPDFTCYNSNPTQPPATPATCNLTGTVGSFFGDASNIDGHFVKAYRLDDILNGFLTNPIASVAISTKDYSLQSLPTNQELVLSVESVSTSADPISNTFTFGVYLRSDACSSGTITIPLAVFKSEFYSAYTAIKDSNVAVNDKKGLAFGILKDCGGKLVQYGTGGVSMGYDLLYYLTASGGWVPDKDATATSAKGLFGVANADPIRGVASAAVKPSGSPTWMTIGTYQFRVFPKMVSLVQFQAPQDPTP